MPDEMVHLVPARPGRDPAVAARLQEYWRDLGVVPPALWHARYVARLAEEEGHSRHTVWGVAAPGAIGLAVLRIDADWVYPERRIGYVAEFTIFAPWRRQGWGRRFFAAVHDWLTAQGCGDIELDVLPINARAAAFWSAVGFRPAYQHMRLQTRP